MKNIKKYLFLGLSMGAVALGNVACSDFEDINVNPGTAGENVVLPYYPLDQSIVQAQQDPHIQERIFVYNWADAARIAGAQGFLSLGFYSDGFNHDYLNGYISKWIKNATLAITLCDKQADLATSEDEKTNNENIRAIARIWRANLIAEFTDCFGPYPLNAFNGSNPEFSSEKDVYYFILNELKEATSLIKDYAPNDQQADSDPIYRFDTKKWVKYGNSLRMRYAMRLSGVDAAKAKAEFEDAAKGDKILTLEDMAKVQESPDGWFAWNGVYSRPWDPNVLSSAMSNILVGLGGISVEESRPDLKDKLKDMDYMGLKFDQHYDGNTDNPTKQFWLDGVPRNLDPRALLLYCMSNDQAASNFVDKGSVENHNKSGMLLDDSGEKKIDIDASCTWNSYPCGQASSFSKKFAKNKVVRRAQFTLPLLSKTYVKSDNFRVWYGPWETYFLLAEAAVYGWNVGTTAKDAYENGVKVSFEHFGIADKAADYLASKDYNRVGTSVCFTHTDEPTSFEAKYVDGYTKEAKTMTYVYPDANKILYKGHKLNDQLTKIITQKYIAQTPYGALEMWNDHRRLGLPFFDLPVNESVLTGSDFDKTWSPDTYESGQKYDVYPQRMRYPSSLKNADPDGYQKALSELGGSDMITTPLWWSLGAQK